jgi:cell division protein FtsL
LRSQRPFLVLWTFAVAASVAAFVLHLALRGRTVELGYQLGRARGDQARLREVKRVLELEAASYETPQRVEVVARTLLGMQPPSADRIVPVTGMAVSLPSAPAVSARTPGPSPAPASEPWGVPPAGRRAER